MPKIISGTYFPNSLCNSTGIPPLSSIEISPDDLSIEIDKSNSGTTGLAIPTSATLVGTLRFTINDGFFGSRRVNPSQDLDEPTMQTIAEKTGGQYFRARNLEELGEIHKELNRLEPIESEQEMFRPVKDLFYWPLAIALLLSFAWAMHRIFYQRERKIELGSVQ